MLNYVIRVRDLVHGTILFTEEERRVIDNPLFQRLRHIHQNDVAFFVYPSLNTTRFEHSLGTCRVAGMMAENITLSKKWSQFSKELKTKTGIGTREDFIRLCRLYGLLHDIGHLPLSHLFEFAVQEVATEKRRIVEDWTGIKGYDALHEAFGALLIIPILESIRESLRNPLRRLMTEKSISRTDPLSIAKAIVDSEIDADRIDATRRDGMLAGGEYGNYDVRRLCDSVFLDHDDERGWFLAYSEKAISSLEALLLDRYRTHVWVHFHHRVVATKLLVQQLIKKAFEVDEIRKSQFNPSKVEQFILLDDPWLWRALRGITTAGDDNLELVKRALFLREKYHLVSLWKNRTEYRDLQDKVKRKTMRDDVTISEKSFPRYREVLGEKLGELALIFRMSFSPISPKAVQLYSETKRRVSAHSLLSLSTLVSSLEEIMESEPQEFVVVLGQNAKKRKGSIRQAWSKITADWIEENKS